MSQFELELHKKDWGKELSASAHAQELETARAVAFRLASGGAEVTIDDLRDALPLMEWGNWSGSVFRGENWVCVGFQPARHKGSHARIVRRWKYASN